MEPLNATASVSAAGDAAEVWCGTQFPTAAQAAAARALDIPAEKVKLNYTLLGGEFGRRGDYAEEFVVDAVLMSKSVPRLRRTLAPRGRRQVSIRAPLR